MFVNWLKNGRCLLDKLVLKMKILIAWLISLFYTILRFLGISKKEKKQEDESREEQVESDDDESVEEEQQQSVQERRIEMRRRMVVCLMK